MKIFETRKRIIDNKRDIQETIYAGQTCYRVVFRQTIRYGLYILGHLLYTSDRSYNIEDDTVFESVKGAEWYAKNARKPHGDKSTFSYMDRVIYLNGDEQLEKYGYFKLNCIHEGPVMEDDFKIEFIFYPKYCNKYGDKITININNYIFLFNDITAEKCIDFVLKKCNNFNGNKIIKSFDVITMESIPIDKLNASTKELTELKALVDRFHENQKTYNELISKLLK